MHKRASLCLSLQHSPPRPNQSFVSSCPTSHDTAGLGCGCCRGCRGHCRTLPSGPTSLASRSAACEGPTTEPFPRRFLQPKGISSPKVTSPPTLPRSKSSAILPLMVEGLQRPCLSLRPPHRAMPAVGLPVGSAQTSAATAWWFNFCSTPLL